jgi:ribonuclease E
MRGARMRMARKPSAVARELLKNFPKGGKRRRKRKRKQGGAEGNGGAPEKNGKRRSREKSEAGEVDLAGADGDSVASGGDDDEVTPVVDAVGDS